MTTTTTTNTELDYLYAKLRRLEIEVRHAAAAHNMDRMRQLLADQLPLKARINTLEGDAIYSEAADYRPGRKRELVHVRNSAYDSVLLVEDGMVIGWWETTRNDDVWRHFLTGGPELWQATNPDETDPDQYGTTIDWQYDVEPGHYYDRLTIIQDGRVVATPSTEDGDNIGDLICTTAQEFGAERIQVNLHGAGRWSVTLIDVHGQTLALGPWRCPRW